MNAAVGSTRLSRSEGLEGNCPASLSRPDSIRGQWRFVSGLKSSCEYLFSCLKIGVAHLQKTDLRRRSPDSPDKAVDGIDTVLQVSSRDFREANSFVKLAISLPYK